MGAPNTPPSLPTGTEIAGGGPTSVAAMAEGALKSVETGIVGLGPLAAGFGFAAFLFKRGAEAIFLQKNPFRGIGKKE